MATTEGGGGGRTSTYKIVVLSMRVSSGVGIEEGAALLEEIVELALLSAGAHLLPGEAACRAGSPQEDIGDLIEGDLFARAELLLLLLHLLPK